MTSCEYENECTGMCSLLNVDLRIQSSFQHSTCAEMPLRIHSLTHSSILPLMALNGLYCADVPLSNYSLTYSLTLVNTLLKINSCIVSYSISTETWDSVNSLKNVNLLSDVIDIASWKFSGAKSLWDRQRRSTWNVNVRMWRHILHVLKNIQFHQCT